MTDILAKVVIVIMALLAAGGAHYVFKMKSDNHIEQTAEVIIKHHTGMDIDLSPESIDGSVDLKHSKIVVTI